MSSYLRPRRGKKSTAIAQLTSSNPLKRGEIFFEVPDDGVGTGAGKIKMGDGVTAYADLPYFSEGGSGGGGVGEDIYISLPSSSWTTETISGTTYYVQNGAAAGATSSTVPVIIPIYSTDTEMEAYSNIIRVESANNVLKFIAVDRPAVNLTVVAKFAVESTADLDVISGALGVEITQAQYDALTPEEQANGTYWITDGSGGSVDTTLDTTSLNAIANKPVAEAITQLNNDLTIKYVNGKLYKRNSDGSIGAEIKVGGNMKVLKYGVLTSTSADDEQTITLGVTLDPSKYIVLLNSNSPVGNHYTTAEAGFKFLSAGTGAYVSAKTSTYVKIMINGLGNQSVTNRKVSYEIVQISD